MLKMDVKLQLHVTNCSRSGGWYTDTAGYGGRGRRDGGVAKRD